MAARILIAHHRGFLQAAGFSPPSDWEVLWPPSPDEAALVALAPQADAILAASSTPRVTAAVIAAASGCRVIQCTGAGYDSVDLEAAARAQIPVCHVPGQNHRAVAEYVVAAAVWLRRQLGWAESALLTGRFAAAREWAMAHGPGEIRQCLVGIVGFGKVGQAVAEAFSPLGARVGFYDLATIDQEVCDRYHAQPMALEALLRESDVVTLHVPLTPGTVGLLSRERLAMMKPGAILINTARGPVVESQALVEALDQGRLGGAAIDVFVEEPPGPSDVLVQAKARLGFRLLLTPHLAGLTQESLRTMVALAVENVDRVLRGETPRHVVPELRAPLGWGE